MVCAVPRGWPMSSPIQLAVGSEIESRHLRRTLETLGFVVVESPATDLNAEAAAMVLKGAGSLDALRRLALRSPDDRPLLLYIAADDSSAGRLAGFAAGADAVLPHHAADQEVAAQLRVFDGWHASRRRWRERVRESQFISQQLQAAYRQIELDLALASKLQASFLPRTLPAVGAARFGVCYRPCGHVGGDFYDVVRLDEHHVGFYLADAMGHGVPASLLTVFLKKAVQPKEVNGSSYRLIPPGEVLARLNRELIAQGLAELPFVTMVYGLLDSRSGQVQFARAAHPHPVYLPHDGAAQQWQTPGTLLGVFEAEYPPLERTLRPGDKLLLYTDGLAETHASTVPTAAAEPDHRPLAIQPLVDNLTERMLAGTAQKDDFTVLGLEMLA